MGGVHEWKSEVVRRGNCENCDMEAKIKRREGAEIAEMENKEEVNFSEGLDGDKDKGIMVLAEEKAGAIVLWLVFLKKMVFGKICWKMS